MCYELHIYHLLFQNNLNPQAIFAVRNLLAKTATLTIDSKKGWLASGRLGRNAAVLWGW
jgi:hypothetical protein